MFIEIPLSPDYAGITVTSTFTTNALKCLYALGVAHTGTIDPPQELEGEVSFSLVEGEGEVRKLGATTLGSSAVLDFEEAGSFTLRTRTTIRTIIGNEVVYQFYTDTVVEVLEWQPTIVLPNLTTEFPLGTLLNVIPSAIALNNANCPVEEGQVEQGFISGGSVAGAITAVADLGTGDIRITSEQHDLSEGGSVTISGTDSYNGKYTVSNVPDINNFDITEDFVADETGIWESYFGFSGQNFSTIVAAQQLLRYAFSRYDASTGDYTADIAVQDYTVVDSDNSRYLLQRPLNQPGYYRLEAEITNCCLATKQETFFRVKDAIEIVNKCQETPDCKDCNTYLLRNYTAAPVSFTIHDTVTDAQGRVVTVESLEEAVVTFDEDSVYTVNWTNSAGEAVAKTLAVTCQIDKCYNDLLKAQLCRQQNNKCCEDGYLDNRLANVQPFYQTYKSSIAKYTQQDMVFTTQDIAEGLKDFTQLGKIRDYLLSICEVCKRNCKDCFKTGPCK